MAAVKMLFEIVYNDLTTSDLDLILHHTAFFVASYITMGGADQLLGIRCQQFACVMVYGTSIHVPMLLGSMKHLLHESTAVSAAGTSAKTQDMVQRFLDNNLSVEKQQSLHNLAGQLHLLCWFPMVIWRTSMFFNWALFTPEVVEHWFLSRFGVVCAVSFAALDTVWTRRVLSGLKKRRLDPHAVAPKAA